MRERGTGRKYLKRGYWWVQVSDHGDVWRESTGLKGKAGENKADRLLAKYSEAIEKGTFQKPIKLRFESMAELLEAEWKANGRKCLYRIQLAVRYLSGTFGKLRAGEIAGRVPKYIIQRLETAKPATVQFELAILKQMFTLASKPPHNFPRPYIPSVEVQNTRKGFFEPDQFQAVLGHLPSYLKPLAEFAYLTGWRKQEILTLQWRQVDFQAQTVRLEPGTTKNDDGRTFPFSTYPQLKALLLGQREHTKALERALGAIIPTVFHSDGKAIKSYNVAWRTACRKAGVPGRLLHDCRRTAVRNLERARVPRETAMQLTGHKSEAVYRRYAIVNEKDLADGVALLADAVGSLKANEAK